MAISYRDKLDKIRLAFPQPVSDQAVVEKVLEARAKVSV